MSWQDHIVVNPTISKSGDAIPIPRALISCLVVYNLAWRARAGFLLFQLFRLRLRASSEQLDDVGMRVNDGFDQRCDAGHQHGDAGAASNRG